MAKAPYKLPNVFVGCPYDKPFDFKRFKGTLQQVPFKFYFADTHLQTKHLLSILTSYIAVVDYCFFDVSTWNPNVSLELGLAEGKSPGDYYILKHRKLSKGVPADIQGIQRIEYSNYNDFDTERGLFQQIVRYLVRDQTHPRNIYDNLNADSRTEKFTVALRILAHLRDHRRLTRDDLPRLVRGSYLRKDGVSEVVEVLRTLGLISDPFSRRGARLRKNLFKDPIRFKGGRSPG